MKNKASKYGLTLRILSAPFILCILIIAHNLFVLERFWHYLKFGGEYVNFEKNEKKTLLEIFGMLKEQNELLKEEKND